jgi:hypothetical protein
VRRCDPRLGLYAIVDDDWPAAKALLEKKIEQHAPSTEKLG